MKLKYFLSLAYCMAALFVPQLVGAQGILVLSNTNQPITGVTNDIYGTRIPFTVGFDQGGYLITGVAFMFGDNSAADFANITISLYGANSPINLDTQIATINVPTPKTAGLHFFAWPTNLFIPGQNTITGTTYYDFLVIPTFQIGSTKELILDYTTSTNYTDNAGWTNYPAYSGISGTPGITALYNIFATVLPPPVLHPIRLTNAVVLPDGTFKFGFTNSPGFNFSAYVTTNPAVRFTNWFYSGSADYLGTNYYEYSTGPGVANSPSFRKVYFRVTSP